MILRCIQVLVALMVVGLSTLAGATFAMEDASEASSVGVANPSSFERGREAALSLAEVLKNTVERHPKGRAALQKRRGTEAAAAGTFGAWDPRLSIEGKSVELGYYRYRHLDAQVTQYTPLWGTSLFAGYRVGGGDFPVYRAEHETLSAGEVRAGVNLPVWQDGPIDSRRAAIEKAKWVAGAASCAELQTRLSLQRAAASAYWAWVATGHIMAIEQDLLNVAEQRQSAISAQAELGALAPVVVLDNQRLVLDRKLKLNAAQQAFREASISLSLYYRDRDDQPILVDDARLPAELSPGERLPQQLDAQVIGGAIAKRPEVCALSRQLEAARVEVELADNRVAPSMDAKGYVARDIGDGPQQLWQTELAVGLSFEMPLGLRQARGERDSALAKRRELEAELQSVRDLIGAEVRTSFVRVQTAYERWTLAHNQLEVARDLAQAEREKFIRGASDLVIVNLRELAAAEAAKQEAMAAAACQSARAEFATAQGREI